MSDIRGQTERETRTQFGTRNALLYDTMLNGLKVEWWRFRNAPAGRRFLACYERHQAREAPWLKPILFFFAVFSLVIGLVLVFMPGPAILFFAIASALLAAESQSVARIFDKVDSWCHRGFRHLRGGRKDARATTKALTPKAAAVIAARAEVLRKEQARRDMRRPSVRGSAELIPQAGEPQRDAEAKRDPNARADADSRRDAVVPPVAAATPIETPTTLTPRSTQAYAPNMQLPAPAHAVSTVKLGSDDVPTPKPSKQTARVRRPRKRAVKPNIVLLPPPVIIGVEKA